VIVDLDVEGPERLIDGDSSRNRTRFALKWSKDDEVKNDAMLDEVEESPPSATLLAKGLDSVIRIQYLIQIANRFDGSGDGSTRSKLERAGRFLVSAFIPVYRELLRCSIVRVMQRFTTGLRKTGLRTDYVAYSHDMSVIVFKDARIKIQWPDLRGRFATVLATRERDGIEAKSDSVRLTTLSQLHAMLEEWITRWLFDTIENYLTPLGYTSTESDPAFHHHGKFVKDGVEIEIEIGFDSDENAFDVRLNHVSLESSTSDLLDAIKTKAEQLVTAWES